MCIFSIYCKGVKVYSLFYLEAKKSQTIDLICQGKIVIALKTQFGALPNGRNEIPMTVVVQKSSKLPLFVKLNYFHLLPRLIVSQSVVWIKMAKLPNSCQLFFSFYSCMDSIVTLIDVLVVFLKFPLSFVYYDGF